MIDKSNPPPSWWSHSEKSWRIIQDFFASNEILSFESWNKIESGQSNDNYCLDLLEAQYFVQIAEKRNQRLRPSVGKCLNLYSKKQLSPIHQWLIPCRFNGKQVRIFDWFDGVQIDVDQLKNRPVIESLLDFLVTLHNITDQQGSLSALLPQMNIHDYLASYREQATQNHPSKACAINILANEAKQLGQCYQATRICHNDLSFSNLIWQPAGGKLKVVDWEYACIGDPLMDLASLMVSCPMGFDQQDWFIDQYQSRLDIRIDQQKLEQMKRLIEIINQLWSMAWAEK